MRGSCAVDNAKTWHANIRVIALEQPAARV